MAQIENRSKYDYGFPVLGSGELFSTAFELTREPWSLKTTRNLVLADALDLTQAYLAGYGRQTRTWRIMMTMTYVLR